MNIVFFGSSEFSLCALKACLKEPFRTVLIVTTPPQRKGRGLIETPTPVQIFAQERKIPFIAPETLKSQELLNEVTALKPELFVVSSYGKMIPSSWLKVPSLYALNVHPSLLPKYRGAAPIQWPIILGDSETGVSIAEVTAALDAGDIFYQSKFSIPADTNAEEWTRVLGDRSEDALSEVLRLIQIGDLTRTPQDHNLWNYARKLKKEDGQIDWTRSALQLQNQVRGLIPWPTVTLQFKGDSVQILKAAASPDASVKHLPGEVVEITQDSIHIQTGGGILSLIRVKPAGKKEMSGGDYARGKRISPGDLFPSSESPAQLVLTQSIR